MRRLVFALMGLVPGLVWGYPGMDKVKAPAPTPPTGSRPQDPPPAGGAAAPSHSHELTADGTVRLRARRAEGGPAAKLPVSLLVTVHGEPRARLEATTDARGRATFRKVPRGDHASHVAVAPYEGVNYYARLEFPPGKDEVSAELEVAKTTTDAADLGISRLHIIVEPTRQRIRVTEVLSVKNAGKRTYVGEPLRIPLFHGAASLKAGSSVEGSYALRGHDLSYTGYLRPGETQLQFEYDLPLTGEYTRETVLPVEKLFVVVTRATFRLSGAAFRSVRELERNEIKFLVGEGGPIPAGGRISFQVMPSREMLASAGAGGPEGAPKGELVKDWRVVVKWLTPLVLLFIFFAAVYLAGRREEDALAQASDAALAAERDRLLPELAAATRSAEAGQKGAARRQAELTRRLAQIYRLLDEHAARRAMEAVQAQGKRAR